MLYDDVPVLVFLEGIHKAIRRRTSSGVSGRDTQGYMTTYQYWCFWKGYTRLYDDVPVLVLLEGIHKAI